jgi:hypothetical protein
MSLEALLLQAHVKLRLVSQYEDGSATTTLARHGPYEVRLYEPPHEFLAGDFLFWIELFDHDCQASLDSRGSYILEDAVNAAEYLIAQAKQFSGQSGRA